MQLLRNNRFNDLGVELIYSNLFLDPKGFLLFHISLSSISIENQDQNQKNTQLLHKKSQNNYTINFVIKIILSRNTKIYLFILIQNSIPINAYK